MKLSSKDEIHELLGAPMLSAVLSAALELGLFWRLADGPQPLEQFSREMGIPLQRCKYWLGLLVTLNLLEQDGQSFLLTPVARREILNAYGQNTWKMIAEDALDNCAEVVSLPERLLASGLDGEESSHRPDHLAPYVRRMAEDLERAHLFARFLFKRHFPLAEDIANALDLEDARRLLDVGGGSGVVSFALLRKQPELTAVLVDIANTCIASREIADELPEGERISYFPADFVLDELPGDFDIVLECDVTQFDDALLSKFAASLRERGRLVIVDRWFEMGSEEIPGRLAWLLRKSLADPRFSLKTIEELQAALARAGLEPESIVELPYNKWKLISARKKVPVGDGHLDVPGLGVHALSFAGQRAVTPRGESRDGD